MGSVVFCIEHKVFTKSRLVPAEEAEKTMAYDFYYPSRFANAGEGDSCILAQFSRRVLVLRNNAQRRYRLVFRTLQQAEILVS
jgi:hypothetical protein